MSELIRQFAQGFGDPSYIERERAAKWSAHELWTSTLGGGQAEQLLADAAFTDLAGRAVAVVARAGVLNRVEAAALRDSLASGAATKRLFTALLGLLSAEQTTDGPLASYFEAVEGLSPRGKTAASRWAIATALPFLARPSAFVFFKQDVSKPAAERLRFDLVYQAEPNAATYDRLLRMSKALLERLAPQHARDLIDVHAYLGVVARYGSSRAQA